MEKTSLYQDVAFKRIVVGSTGFGLACMLAGVASIHISEKGGLEFGWHWSIFAIVAGVVLWNMRFWKIVWKVQNQSGTDAKKKLVFHLGILLFLGIGSFLYPIRFVEQGYIDGILKGLITAGTFLGTMLTLIYKCAKGISEIDAVELQRQGEAPAQS